MFFSDACSPHSRWKNEAAGRNVEDESAGEDDSHIGTGRGESLAVNQRLKQQHGTDIRERDIPTGPVSRSHFWLTSGRLEKKGYIWILEREQGS